MAAAASNQTGASARVRGRDKAYIMNIKYKYKGPRQRPRQEQRATRAAAWLRLRLYTLYFIFIRRPGCGQDLPRNSAVLWKGGCSVEAEAPRGSASAQYRQLYCEGSDNGGIEDVWLSEAELPGDEV